MNPSLIEQINRIRLDGVFKAPSVKFKTRVSQKFDEKDIQDALKKFLWRRYVQERLELVKYGSGIKQQWRGKVPHFRVGKILFFTRTEHRPGETHKKKPSRQTVYNLETTPPSPLLPTELHKEKYWRICELNNITGKFSNAAREGGIDYKYWNGNYRSFVSNCLSAAGVPIVFHLPDFSLAKQSPNYAALYGTRENMDKHADRFYDVVNLLKRSPTFYEKWTTIESLGVDAIHLEDVSVADKPIQAAKWLGVDDDEYLNPLSMKLYGKFGVINSIGRLNDLAEKDKMDEMWSFSTNQKKLDESCVLSVILELYALKLNRETPDDEEDCSICLSSLLYGDKDWCRGKCGNSFHIECLNIWLPQNNTCPNCRGEWLACPSSPTSSTGEAALVPFSTPKQPRLYFSLKSPEPQGGKGSFWLSGQAKNDQRLTYESLSQFLGIAYNPDGHMGASIETAFPFFVKFKIELEVYDIQHRLIFKLPTDELKEQHPEYDYKTPTADLPKCRVMVAHRHLFLLEDIRLDFAKKVSVIQKKSYFQTLKPVSKLFPLTLKKKNTKKAQEESVGYVRENMCCFVEDVEEIVRIVKEVANERDEKKRAFMAANKLVSKRKGGNTQKKPLISLQQLEYFNVKIRFIVGDIYDLLLSLVANGICPSLRFDSSSGKSIKAMYFSYHSVRVEVSDGGLQGLVLPISQENFSNFEKAHLLFKDVMIRKQFLSKYNEDAYKFERLHPIGPITRSFVAGKERERYFGIDVAKAYTSCLFEMPQFPVFNEFDTWREYDGHPIEDYTQYFVSVRPETIDGIFFTQQRCRVFGYHLKRMPIDPFPYIAVLFYKRPSHLAPSDSASAIDKLWATNIDLQFPENDEKMKKFIVNQTIGAMGRVKNYSTHSQVFVDYAEAMYYKTRYGGTIFAKQRSRLASWVAQGDPEYDELDGEEVNHMKRHNKLVPCLLDCVNLFDDHIYQIHYEAYSLREMVEAFQELLGQEFCPPLNCSTLSSIQLHLFLKKTEWFKKAITAYIAAKKAGAFERFFQRHQEDPSPSLDVFKKLLKSAKFNSLRDQFFEPQDDCVPLSCPLTGEIINEPWRNKYGRVFQKSQQLLDYVEQQGQCPIDGIPLTLEDFQPIPEDKIPQRVFIWKQEDDAELTEGFVAIKEFVYLSCRLKLFKIMKLLQSKFGQDCVVAVRTDCLLLDNTLKMIEMVEKEQKTQPPKLSQKPPNQHDIRQWIGGGAQAPSNDTVQQSRKKETTKSATVNDVRDFLGASGYSFGNLHGQLRVVENQAIPDFRCVDEKVGKIEPTLFEQQSHQEFDDETNIPPESVVPNTQILGLYPGVGKTTLAAKLFPDKPHVYATPFNRLSQELRRDMNCEALTVHKLIGKGMADETKDDQDDGDKKRKKKDNSKKYAEGTVIVFDEIYLNSVKMLADMWSYMKQNPHLIFVATGDVYQLPPIDQSLNNLGGEDDDPQLKKEYYKRAIAQMFPSSILLKQIKRLTDAEQKQRIHKLKFELFDAQPLRPTDQILKDLFGADAFVNQKDISRRSICYFSKKTVPNSTQEINELQQLLVVAARKIAGQPVEEVIRYDTQEDGGQESIFYLWNGMTIICSKSFVADKDKCYTNFQYTVHHIDKARVYFFDAVEGEAIVMSVLKTEIHKHFQYSFAGTAHSYQGLSLGAGEKTTILHANHAFSSREWLYVAITRARDLNDLQFVLLNENEVKDSQKWRKHQYWSFKIDQYKEQDRRAGRSIEETDTLKYINEDWFKQKIRGKTSCKCGAVFEVVYMPETASVKSNLTANRIDNRLSHFIQNIQAMCLDCNRRLGNRPNRYGCTIVSKHF